MITLKTFVFNPFQENTYILHDETNDCIIIDPGCYEESEKVALDSYISKNNLHVKKLVLTHCHVDHLLGCAHVKQKYNPEVIANKNDIFLIKDAQKHGIVFGFKVEQPPQPDTLIEAGNTISFGNSGLKVLFVPGHSPGSVALYSATDNFIITGDVLFKGSIGRTDLPGGDYDELMKNIINELMSLPPDTVVFPGHGPSTTIHEEALSNPFLVR